MLSNFQHVGMPSNVCESWSHRHHADNGRTHKYLVAFLASRENEAFVRHVCATTFKVEAEPWRPHYTDRCMIQISSKH